ncbi:Htaa protein [Geodermatophilus amargosae]|uniref:Htaa protein n=1 Tax=Geodermatophilus amargosae TaxID=1296565 RepID=A0A1I7CPB3_9ACTN|nr:HtaA domain-containing protein [Geodermatophilus amargosae]SFU01275.1 Htaa protein [Geodermatophilus amargosae]
MTESPPPASTRPEFGLRWGIKGSFLEYVQRMPDGKGWLGDGAVAVGTNEILFPPERTGWRPSPDGVPDRFWAFRGDVRFSGHHGMLFVRLAFPVLTLRGEHAELTVTPLEDTESAERLTLVTLSLAQQPSLEGIEIWHGTDVRLTGTGAELFNDVYPLGAEFEPLTVTVPLLDASE